MSHKQAQLIKQLLSSSEFSQEEEAQGLAWLEQSPTSEQASRFIDRLQSRISNRPTEEAKLSALIRRVGRLADRYCRQASPRRPFGI